MKFISLIVAIAFLILFLWSVKSGQYEDDYTPSVRILFDDEKSKSESETKNKSNNNKENSKTKN